jgi:hypothetical protein
MEARRSSSHLALADHHHLQLSLVVRRSVSVMRPVAKFF